MQKALEKQIRQLENRTNKKIKITKEIGEMFEEIINTENDELISQYLAKRSSYFQKINSSKDTSTINKEVLAWFKEKWQSLEGKLCVVPGKIILRKIREQVQKLYSVNLTDYQIIDEFKPVEVPEDISLLISKLESFRKHKK